MRSLALSIIRGAYEKGKVTILDPNIRLEIWDSIEELKRVMFNAMRHTTAFLASIDEASLLTSLSSPRDIGIHLVRNFNISLVALKMGKDGAYVFTNEGEEVQMKAFDVKIIDTTGAGDAWNAGFIYSYYFKGEGLKESVKFANAVAGLKCRDYGAMYPLPTLEEVKRFLSENK